MRDFLGTLENPFLYCKKKRMYPSDFGYIFTDSRNYNQINAIMLA